jgi:hypothetical protein
LTQSGHGRGLSRKGQILIVNELTGKIVEAAR